MCMSWFALVFQDDPYEDNGLNGRAAINIFVLGALLLKLFLRRLKEAESERAQASNVP